MRNVWTVAAREYTERVKTPVFILTTLMVLLMTLAIPVLTLFIGGELFAKTNKLALYDATGKLGTDFMAKAQAEEQPAPGQLSQQAESLTTWEIIPIGEAELPAYEAEARSGKIMGVLVVRGSFPKELQITYKGSGTGSAISLGDVRRAISRQAHEAAAREAGLDEATIKFLANSVEIEMVDLSSGATQTADDAGLRMALGMMVMMLVYMSVLTSGSMLFQGVLEEKTSRVVELMAAAVKPTHMMLGKIIGLGLLSLTQFSFAILAFTGFTAVAGALAVQMGSLTIGRLLLVALLGLLGYFMYASMFAAAGAMVNRMEDSGMAMMPILLPIMLPVVFSQLIMNHPDSNMAVGFSLFPLFTPTMMAQRLILTNPPAWQVVLSILLAIGTCVLITWLAGRVYRIGILSYGNRPSFKQLWTYLKG